MILSVSRRTDIPQFYPDWFFNRRKEGYLYVRNPRNSRQISRIDLSPDQVELIVFWTKNPEPMMKRIRELGDTPFYIQFTLTGYGEDVEPGLPDKRRMINVFNKTAEQVGKDRMVWRYDPIFLNSRYNEEYHLRAFEKIAGSVWGSAEKVVISFLDKYGKTERNMSGIPVNELSEEGMKKLGGGLARIADAYGLRIEACAEKIDLSSVGVSRGSCIDPLMAEHLLGGPVCRRKDKNQRMECGCLESIEVGAYDTCLAGCRYCYANDSAEAVKRMSALYNANSPLLCGKVEERDKITLRKGRSIREYPTLPFL
ncbi:DUF1848 domain-containing protein [Lacrimispora saccharolytica]|uniref:DUF1848 domain-containing protein n=1 Tax=Lacrimispora saccharolytica (strain ATCC 35040 / DSM 2544 / NRCC 2533 / WM1) TaxID=610130 RepID=D9R1N9_LACSW|nr:DUF1848 domain-containing protein [Lacrimispora saccharolytica]ADL06562.1 Domain of unknown function DUF1848 [[Clostridium] saccharolyticum WM1]QRV19361.1 DUF1848 domain-containing protein [Lacrimispora saccharolytica]